MNKVLDKHVIDGTHDNLIIYTNGNKRSGTDHRYDIHGLDTTENSYRHFKPLLEPAKTFSLLFQDGPIPKGFIPNGLTVEALIAICIDRLEGFQEGEFPCIHNKVAIEALELALGALHERTMERIERGVKGKDIE